MIANSIMNDDSLESASVDGLLKGEVTSNGTDQTASLSHQHPTQRHYYQLSGSSSLSSLDNSRSLNKDSLTAPNVDQRTESLAIEAAVAIVINGIHYAVLMASPSDLEYLAVGFLMSEGLIDSSQDLLDWEITHLTSSSNLQAFTSQRFDESMTLASLAKQLQDYEAYVVELTLNQRSHQRIKAQRRQLSGRTGCGMCGMTGLSQALPDLSRYLENDVNLNDPDAHGNHALKPKLEELLALREQIATAQQTHQLTGAVHAAATVYKGQLKIFEDVGRHNALDKLLGWQQRHNAALDCVVMTSRLSIELVQKAIRARLPWLVGMSAPTSTAVRVAERYGLGLAGFLRDDRVTFYSSFKHFSENPNHR